MLEQGGHRRGRRKVIDTDAGRHVVVMAVDAVGQVQHRQNLVAHMPGLHACADRVRAQADQQQVSDLVATRVVDGLEVVQINEQHRTAQAAALRGDEGLSQPPLQRAIAR